MPKIALILLLVSLSNWTNAQSASSVVATSNPIADENVVLQSRQQINDIVFSKDYIVAKPNTRWQRKETKQDNINQQPKDIIQQGYDFSSFIEIASQILKGILIAFLLGFFFWLYLKRDKWLGWFANIRRHKRTPNKLALNEHISNQLLPMWHGLPDKDSLVGVVQQALADKNWLLALSILYRGTLREILPLHDLPITRASTERQCQWLLQKAETCQPAEANFFKALVNIWLQIAYGKKLPNAETSGQFHQHIEQLLLQWQQLYLWQTYGEQQA